MALLFMDGFDAGDFLQKWSSNAGGPTSSTTVTRFGGSSLNFNSSGATVRRNFTASNKVIIGAAYTALSTSTANTSTGSIQFYGDSGVTEHIRVGITASGAAVYRGSTQLALVATGVPEPIGGVWVFVEASCTVSDTVGNVVVRINGVEVINFTGDTKNAGTASTIDSIQIGRPNASVPACWFDDVYICNDTGTVNNAFLGDVRVQTLVPNGAGTTTQFTPTGTVNNWQNVDEMPFSATDFNTGSTSGNRDLYAHTDLSAGTATIKAVQHNLVAKKNDSGARSIKTAVKSGATVYTGTSTSLLDSDMTISTIREVDPATSAAWTVSAVNALEAGAEVV